MRPGLQSTWALLIGVFLVGAGIAGCAGGGAKNGGGPAIPTLSLSVTPATVTAYPGFTFAVVVTANESGTTATPTITLGALPAGLSTTATFPMSVPAEGATLSFTAASSMATGSYSIPVSGSASVATVSSSIPVQVTNGTPSTSYFSIPINAEVGLIQGSSTTLQFELVSSSKYEVSLGILNLPPGVSAVINPQVVVPTQSFTVTLKASANAPYTQNAIWTLTGMPAANVAAPSLDVLLDVTPTTGVGWTNRTSYVSTRATPFSAVYDPPHGLIYASNQVWNRIEVISDQTHQVVKSISIRDPRGMDLSVDGKTVWVATGSQVMYAIDTASFQAKRYQLPAFNPGLLYPAGSWEGAQVVALADGTLIVTPSPYAGSGINSAVIWSPATNTFTSPSNFSSAPWGAIARSGDGKHVFSLGEDESETSFTYDVLSQTLSKPVSLSSFGYASVAKANGDGSMVAVSSATGFALYDSNLNLIGSLPGDGGGFSFSSENLLFGGFVFSPDGSKIYEETEATSPPTIVTISTTTGQVTALAPAMPVIPTFTEMSPAYHLPIPFAMDSSGMLLGIQYHGIAFDDAAISLNFSPLEPGSPVYLQHMSPYSGPLAGGTKSGGFGNGFALAPDVYYGVNKGIAALSSNNLSITSPPATTPGPVDVKILFPDGNEVFNPQFFTYGTQVQDAIISGGSPDGGAAAKLDAFGLPLDPSQDVVTIGGNTAAVTSTVTQYPPFTGEQTAMFLSYTTPPGTPGWADLTVKTPNGSSTLSKAFFFAQSVRDYSTTDVPTFVLYDNNRNQLYLSAGDHIDVFSLTSNNFATVLQPPSISTSKQFQGLALTPDGKYLLAADLTDGSLAVIDPDAPSTAYVINIAGSNANLNCFGDPLFVSADNGGNAYVLTGGLSAQQCGNGDIFVVNLAAKTATQLSAPGCKGFAAYLSSGGGGRFIATAEPFQIYSPALQSCGPSADPPQQQGTTASADGNVLGMVRAFVDPSGNIIGRFAYPAVLYPSADAAVYYNYSPYQDGARPNPALNDAGSLYYWAYPNYVDIVDVQHGIRTLRLALTETVANVLSPMAIDSGGQHIYLVTNQGLTVVDLGNAPLSIGHLSQETASPGSQITVRGSGFEEGITASLGGNSAFAAFKDENTLTITIPPSASGLQDLLLTNPDGTSYVLQNALTVQ